MKKLVTIMVVLALATVANAMSLELSINGVTDGASTVTPAETTLTGFVIDIYDSQGYDYANGGGGGDNRYFVIATQSTLGTINAAGTVIVAGHGTDCSIIDSSSATLETLGFANSSGTFGFIGSYSALTWGAGKVMDSINANVQESSIITLYSSVDGATFTAVDSIKVVPEPMTMALLGLGGLFIRRKMA